MWRCVQQRRPPEVHKQRNVYIQITFKVQTPPSMQIDSAAFVQSVRDKGTRRLPLTRGAPGGGGVGSHAGGTPLGFQQATRRSSSLPVPNLLKGCLGLPVAFSS